jgi:hypothetical protein
VRRPQDGKQRDQQRRPAANPQDGSVDSVEVEGPQGGAKQCGGPGERQRLSQQDDRKTTAEQKCDVDETVAKRVQARNSLIQCK